MVRILLVGVLLLGATRCGGAESSGWSVDELPFGVGSVGPSGGCVTLLLRMPDVHRELDLTPTQIGQLRSQLQAVSRDRRSLFENLVEGKVFDEPIDGPMLRRLLDEYTEQSEEALANLLTPNQKTRFVQLQFQIQGTEALRQASVVKSLQLTSSQREKIAATLTAAVSASDDDRTLSIGEVNQRVLHHLSGRQQVQWQAMQGEPFPFVLLRMKYGRSKLTRETRIPKKSSLAVQ